MRHRIIQYNKFCLIMIPVGAMGCFWPGMALWGLWGGRGWLVGCVQSRKLNVSAPRLSRFILLVSFSDTLLVVSILDITYVAMSFVTAFAVLEGLNKYLLIENQVQKEETM